MTQFTVILPLPPPALWANSRVHWSVRHRETRFARRLARVEAVRALDGQPPPMWEAATMNVRFSMPHLRFDASNLMRSLKAYEDGLQDAGIVRNDRGLWPARPEVVRDPAVRDHPVAMYRLGIVRLCIVAEEVVAS